MRFLSLSRPWAWSIFDAVADKGIENRTWAPPLAMIGQSIAIQAAKSWDVDALTLFLKNGVLNAPARYDQHPSGVIIGVATIYRVVTEARTLPPHQARWFFGPYGWVLTDRRKLATPVPCKGAQGLRTLDPAIEQQVMTVLHGGAP